MIFKDYYKILGLNTNKVEMEEIKAAYREQAKKYHPDVNIGNRNSEERFKDISEAYRVLSTASGRRKYDRMWNAYIGKRKKKCNAQSKTKSDSVVSDFFNMFFVNLKENSSNEETENIWQKNKRVPVKGDNIETEVDVSIEEAFYGMSKKISFRTVDGKLKTFLVKVPAGIRNKEKVRLLGQGKPGKNGGKNGDLFIKINIEDDAKYKLKGYDLYTNLFITPWEAVLGTKVKISNVDEEISINVPKGIQSGEKIEIEGKGYKDGVGGRGKLVVKTKIMVPKQLSEEEKEIYKKLKDVSSFNPRQVYNGNIKN